MRFGGVLAFLLLTAACSRYDDNDLVLLTRYAAKQTCSCVFVMNRDERFCDAWARETPDAKTVTIDYRKKEVEAQAGVLWGAKARFVDRRHGCVLE